MKITIGSDHRGFELKEEIKKNFSSITWLDVGTDNDERVDYPIYAKKVCDSTLSGLCDLGILICGSGVGVSIAANRFSGIYAALCWSPEIAKAAREHDNANVLALSSDFVSQEINFKIIESWLSTKFLGGRYQDRLELLEKIK